VPSCTRAAGSVAAAAASRRATLSCASAIAALRRGDGGAGACEVSAKSGNCFPTSRFSRLSTASGCSVPRARLAARVISRVSSPTSVEVFAARSADDWKSVALRIPVGVPKPPFAATMVGRGPPVFERRMNGRRSTSGSTWRCSKKRLTSWYASSANSDNSSWMTD
jgi:hypothetical protein